MHRIHFGLSTANAVVLLLMLGTGLACLGAATQPLPLPDPRWMRLHIWIGFLGAIFTCLVHVIVMFYLVGTGITIKEGVVGLPGAADYVRRTRRFKGRAFPFSTMSMLFIIGAVVLGGAVHTRVESIAPWVHGLVSVLAIALNAFAFRLEYRILRENSELIRAIDKELIARAEAAAAPAASA